MSSPRPACSAAVSPAHVEAQAGLVLSRGPNNRPLIRCHHYPKTASIANSLLNEVGILENLAKQEKITSYSLPTNLVFLVTWQILPLRRAYMHARKRFGIAISVVSATLGRRRSTYRHGCCFLFYLALSPVAVGRRRRWPAPAAPRT